MDKRKLTGKEIFRTIAFQYKQDERISLNLIAQIVAGLYYPRDNKGDIKKRYQLLLVHLLKEYTHQEKTIGEQEFIIFMNDMAKHANQEYTTRTATRIFNRYANKEQVIDQEGFEQMYSALKLHPSEVTSYFYNIADRKNQITLKKFLEFVNSFTE